MSRNVGSRGSTEEVISLIERAFLRVENMLKTKEQKQALSPMELVNLWRDDHQLDSRYEMIAGSGSFMAMKREILGAESARILIKEPEPDVMLIDRDFPEKRLAFIYRESIPEDEETCMNDLFKLIYFKDSHAGYSESIYLLGCGQEIFHNHFRDEEQRNIFLEGIREYEIQVIMAKVDAEGKMAWRKVEI